LNQIKVFVFILIWFLPGLSFGQDVQRVHFAKGFTYLYLSGENEYLRLKHPLTLSELTADAKSNTLKFSRNFKTTLDSSVYCIKIEVQNIDNEDIDVIMLVDYPRIDHFNFVMFEKGKPIKTFSKYILDTKLNILGNNLMNVLPLTFKAKTTYKLYFQIDNSISLNKLKLPLKFISKSYYPTQQFWARLFEEIYIGTLFFNVAFTLIFCIFYRRRIYLYYFFYLLGLVVFYVCVNNFTVYFSDSQTLFKNNWTGISLSYFLMLVGYVHFTEDFLNVSEFVKPATMRLFRILKKCFYLYFVISLSFLWLFDIGTVKLAAVSIYFIKPLMLIYIWYFIFKAIQNKFRPTYFFVLSYFPIFFVGFFLDPLSISGLIGGNVKAIFFGSHIFEFFTLSIAIIYRFRLIEIEKNNLNFTLVQQKQNLIKVVLNAQEMERERLAKDLHDDLGATLSALKSIITSRSEKTQIIPLIDRAIQDLRNISKNLLPLNLSINGLSKAVQQNINYLQIASNIEFEFITFGKKKQLSEEQDLHIYRIISELLNNIVKHSLATRVTMQLIYHNSYAHISIEDNGIGIDKQKVNSGIGLLNIQSRIEYLKSKLIIETNETGTLIAFDVYYL
jgi:signal transduction histidine kinase